jgi:Na+-transporting methylmalonyl-CoA/oxaloacetate decarboxylase gamma subunit
MELTGVTINPVYSFGEKMSTAALNTVICMSIVFTVLICISLIISAFKIFPYLEAKKKEKEAAAKAATVENNVVTQIEQREEQEQEYVDDTELVAVIAAAIAAYEGTSTDGFVVRSIRRR